MIQFNISIHFKIVITSLVTNCHHTKILCNYWLFFTVYISYSWLIYIATGHLYLLISLTYFSPPAHSPAGNHLFIFCIYDCFYLVMSICSFFFQNWHISEIIQYLSFSVWDILFGLISSSSILDNTNDNILCFFMVE